MLDLFKDVILIMDSAVRLSVPLLLACLAGLYSERSGIVDIGLEGKMLAAAFAAGAFASVYSSAWIGLGAGMIISISFSMLHGFASITQRGNQIVSGVALNFIVLGLTTLIGQHWFHEGGATPQLKPDERFLPLTLPGADSVSDVPYLGLIYSELLSGHSLLTYLAYLAVPLTWWVLYRTRFGLRLRAVGENPQAVDTAGISVIWLRYRALIITGILCGIAGTYLSIAQGGSFIKDMVAGRGYIALAALIFAKWNPKNALWTCLLFGFLDALAIRLQGTSLPMIGTVPVQFIHALPYILTVILLAGFIGRAIPPKASGIPYSKER